MAWGKIRPIALASVLFSALAAPFGTAVAAAASAEPSPAGSMVDRAPAITCMTSAILYEAGYEPRSGQEAVAEVILNRLHHPAFPKTICGVVFQGSERRTGCQFSFTCDGSLRKSLPLGTIARAREVATRAIDGQLSAKIAGATHYHADYVSPYWAPTLIRVGAIGRHIFYRQPGAMAFSITTRYDARGDQMPSALTSNLRAPASTIVVTSVAAEQPAKPERFSPWGLAPLAIAQVRSGTKL